MGCYTMSHVGRIASCVAMAAEGKLRVAVMEKRPVAEGLIELLSGVESRNGIALCLKSVLYGLFRDEG